MSGDFAPPPGPSAPDGTARPARRPSRDTPPTADAREASRPRSLLRSGKGVAMAAWIAIGAGVALLIGLSWSAALSFSDRGLGAADVGETGNLHSMQIVPGMCLDEVGGDGAIGEAAVVPCDQPHLAEVFTSERYDLFAYPGDEEVTSDALEICGGRLDGLLPEGSSWVAWAPSEASWERGDRVTLCIAVFEEAVDEPLSPAGIEAAAGEDAEDDEPARDGQDA